QAAQGPSRKPPPGRRPERWARARGCLRGGIRWSKKPSRRRKPRLFSTFATVKTQNMSIMPDTWIRQQAMEHGMIEPFVERQQREGVISYGLSSYGYDARVSDEFKIFTNVDNAIVDPKDFADTSFVDRTTPVCVIPPNSFALSRTVELIRVPRDVLVICLGKSTYARCGLIVNVTPLEPEWEGHVTLEISNTTPLPAKVY